jgi:proteasome lid subunit RPN8/RPN11
MLFGRNFFEGFDAQRVPAVSHNHPSGDPTPSQADIRMTKVIISIAEPLEILVQDHIIVDRNGHAGQKSPQLIRHCRERSSQQSSLRFPERS